MSKFCLKVPGCLLVLLIVAGVVSFCGDFAADREEKTEIEDSAAVADVDPMLYQKIVAADRPSQILIRTAYVASYNKDTRGANWVAWHLTAENAYADIAKRGNFYHEDEEVPTPRFGTKDLRKTGFSRGHLCPAGDNKWDADAMYDCFLMTNMLPQDRNLNNGDWNELENKCRKWARSLGDIYIVCGPLPYKKPWETIGPNDVVIPRAFFKVVLYLDGEGGGEAIGFVYKNMAQDNPMSSYINSLREVERLTGIEFFPALDDDVKSRIEDDYDLNFWGIRNYN